MIDVSSVARLPDSTERTRFDALRRRVAEEMARSSSRWRLTWVLPFNLLVVGLLITRGESHWRAIIQVAAVATMGSLFAARTFFQAPFLRAGTFFVGVLSYFAMIATTGGLASPLLVMGALMITAAAIVFRDPPWMRSAVFIAFLVGFLTLALLSRTPLGSLGAPLEPNAGWPSPDYVAVALLAAVFTMVGVYRVGCSVTRGYERAAFELAERREELCSENEDRTRALEGVAARLAHEVKNPLAAIKALSSHMARNATDTKTAERLAIVAAEADRLQAIVNGFLSFSRGLEELKPGPTRPYEVARELAVLLETRAEDAGVTLQVEGNESLVVEADARKLRQALLNIVLNAIQASPRGSTVGIDVATEGDGARVTVRDDGQGMTPEVIDRIRKPHFTTKEGGTGLGVAVARGLIEQHGGHLEFKSAPGKGTVATLRLLAKAIFRDTALPNPQRVLKSGCPGPASAPQVSASRGVPSA
jgi:two-component system, NtrC family, sensor histidine kinase HydH